MSYSKDEGKSPLDCVRAWVVLGCLSRMSQTETPGAGQGCRQERQRVGGQASGGSGDTWSVLKSARPKTDKTSSWGSLRDRPEQSRSKSNQKLSKNCPGGMGTMLYNLPGTSAPGMERLEKEWTRLLLQEWTIFSSGIEDHLDKCIGEEWRRKGDLK